LLTLDLPVLVTPSSGYLDKKRPANMAGQGSINQAIGVLQGSSGMNVQAKKIKNFY